jgi:hypothetical protein
MVHVSNVLYIFLVICYKFEGNFKGGQFHLNRLSGLVADIVDKWIRSPHYVFIICSKYKERINIAY